MKYVLTPTDDDILHYKKGSESKSHKYISRVLNKGKWVYIYAKNRMRGNRVTNKNVKPIGQFKSDPFGDKLQYSPTIKTETIDKNGHRSKVLTEPINTRDYLDGTTTWKDIAKKYGITGTGPGDTWLNTKPNAGKEVVTNQGSPNKQYNPTIKTVDTNRDIGGTLIDTRHGGQEVRKALAENMTANTKVSGLTLFGNIMNTGMEYSVTNNTGRNSMSKVSSQYTPSYNRNTGSTYSPTMKTLKYTDGKYRPTEPLDWRKKASTKTNKRHAINATRGGFPVKK